MASRTATPDAPLKHAAAPKLPDVAEWATTNPELAQRLAGRSQPSRRDFSSIGLPEGTKRERRLFVRALRGVIGPTFVESDRPAAKALAEYEREKGYSTIAEEGGRGFRTRKNQSLISLRSVDQEYARLKAATQAETQSLAAQDAALARNRTELQRQRATSQVQEGNVTRENVKFAPLHELPDELRTRIQDTAKLLIDATDSKTTKAALEKIVKDAGSDVGADMEAQKARIVSGMLGERELQDGRDWGEAPLPPDPVAQVLLSTPEDRGHVIDEAIKSINAGSPDPLAWHVENQLRAAFPDGSIEPDEVVAYLETLRTDTEKVLAPAAAPEAAPLDDEFDTFFSAAKGPKRSGRRTFSPADFKRAFPGSTVTALPDGNHRVELPNGQFFEIRQVERIPIDWAALEKRTGRAVPAAERQGIEAAGAWRLRLSGGDELTGVGLLDLAANLADDGTLRHEALHVARSLGLFTDAEWAAMVRKHAPDAKTDLEQEEAIAEARDVWQGEQSILRKIQAWLRGMLAKLFPSLVSVDAKTAMALMDHPEFWARPAKPKKRTGRISYEFKQPSHDELIAKPDIPIVSVQSRFEGDIAAARKWALRNLRLHGPVTNADTGEKIAIGRTAIEKSMSESAARKSGGSLDHAEVAQALRKLLEVAVLAESKPDRSGNPDIRAIHRFFAPLVVDDRAYRVRLTVKEYTRDQAGFYTHELAEIEMPAWKRADGVTDVASATHAGISSVSVADLLRGANREDGTPFFQLRKTGAARPDLANPGQTKPVRDLVDDTDRQRTAAGQPETRGDIDVAADAGKRLKDDYDGERRRLIAVAAC